MKQKQELKLNTGNGERKWHQRPDVRGITACATIAVATAMLLQQCGTKPKPPEPPKCEECCPPGFRKEVSKQPFGVNIKCVDPLTEPRCGDGKCSSPQENFVNCPQDCPAPETPKPRKPRARPAPVETEPEETPKKVGCIEAGAAPIGASEVPVLFKRAVVTGVSKHRTELSGKTVEVTYLVCPNPDGQKGVHAKLLRVSGADNIGEEVRQSVRSALEGKTDGSLAISQAKVYRQDVAF